ncbi:hypothetical protein ACFO9Q_03025 [Paenibacillus sp. GCM10023252]|uniref:hypothetical protein n=1 Tax=Paenibacillus sp. GCM10023252 TaxID=3252649 RepID=UPI00361F1D69
MNINKKIMSLWIAFISLSVLLVIYNFIPATIMWYDSIWQYKAKDFDTYKSDFQIVADLAYREYNKGQMKSSYINVEENPDGTVNLNYENINTEDFVDITMSSKEKNSLEKIVANAFRDGDLAYLSLIRTYENQVEFEIENGHYSLIYRRDKQKPKFLNKLSYSKGHFKLKKISDHWYHARFVED